MHFIPLNSGGLWDAVIITPPVTSGRFLTKCWSAGVGTMPRSRTSEPTDMRPDARALLIISDEHGADAPPYAEGELAAQVLVGDSAYAVGSEHLHFDIPSYVRSIR